MTDEASTGALPAETGGTTTGAAEAVDVAAGGAAPAATGGVTEAPAGVEQQSRLVEAVLALEAEPQSVERVARLTGLGVRAARAAIAHVQRRFADAAHGVQVLEVADGYTLVPKPELWPWLRPHYGRMSQAKMSRAALETLTIIAYSQPVTRGEIESIRGVAPDAMIRILNERHLIREVGRKDAPGRPIQYGTSAEFLRLFGLTSIAELPKLDEPDQARFKTADD